MYLHVIDQSGAYIFFLGPFLRLLSEARHVDIWESITDLVNSQCLKTDNIASKLWPTSL